MLLKKVSIIASMALMLSMGSISLSNAQEEVKSKDLNEKISTQQSEILNGWVKESGHWYYYQNGAMLMDQWIQSNGNWYYLSSYGNMVTKGTHLVDGKYYIFDEEGFVIYKKGWISFSFEGYVDGSSGYTDWYYSNGDGTVKIEQWIKENNKWYYAWFDGRLICEQAQSINGKWYIFDKNGKMVDKKGWIQLTDHMVGGPVWYYAKGDGTMKIDQWMKENNKWYYFGENNGYTAGIMYQGGVYEVKGDIYLFDSSGAMIEKKGWVSVFDGYEKNWFYSKGDGTVKIDQWINSAGKWYYVNEYGCMYKDFIYNINGKDYIFDANGVCQNP